MDMQEYNRLARKWIKDNSKESLKELRMFLDRSGAKMPKKLFPYDHTRPFTWKYLDFISGGDKKNNRSFVRKWIINEIFRG